MAEHFRKTSAALLAATMLAGGVGLTAATAMAATDPATPAPTDPSATSPAADTGYETEINGRSYPMTANTQGIPTLTISDYNSPLPDVKDIHVIDKATGKDMGGTATLTKQPDTDYSKVGVIDTTTTGTYTYRSEQGGDKFEAAITITARQTVGKQITVDAGDQHQAFKDDNGTATASIDLGDIIDGQNKPTVKELTLSNGQTLPITWQGHKAVSDPANGTVITYYGHAYGKITVNEQGVKHTWHADVTVTAGRSNKWTAVIDGKETPLTTKTDGDLTHTHETIGAYPSKTVTVTPTKGTPLTLNGAITGNITDSGILGKAAVSGQASYRSKRVGSDLSDPTSTPGIDILVPYEYMTGTELQVQPSDGDGIAFTKQADGTYKATAPNITLGTDNKPAASSIKTSDDTTHTITWDKTPTTVDKTVTGIDGKPNTVRYVQLNGTATGTTTVKDPATGKTITQNYEIDVTANRAEDKHFTLQAVTRTPATGDPTSIPITGFDENKTDYTITLPMDDATDVYSLGEDHGVDATVGKPAVSLGQNAARVLSIDANGKTYRVTINFKTSDLKPDSTAKLNGIYVNKSGDKAKGALIDNWDPNRLDYVVTIGEHDPSPYILPEAADGVTVKAGDVEQSADAAKQTWTVTDTKTGVSRDYTVTVVRQHAWKTAVEEFTPKDPVAQTQTETPKDDKDTTLTSHGYVDKNGKYTPVTDSIYDIPEGGVFSYKAKAGQSASVSVAKTNGMTYRYTVTVLPKDTNAAPSQQVFTVTYITAKTHAAALTGIAVDGSLISGFNPDTHEYTVGVGNPDKWTVSPQYDKLTGMSVKTDKQGADATITVTSGDGEIQTVYKVHVTRNLIPGAGTVGVGGKLAQTGVSMTAGLTAMLATLTATLTGMFAGRRIRNRKEAR